MHALKAHFTDDAAVAQLIGHNAVLKVPVGYTSKEQPLDVCINKSLRSILRQCWEDHVVKVGKDAGDEANNNPGFKFSSQTRQDIVNWVHRGCVSLQESTAMIQLSFEECGKITTNSRLVSSDDFLERIMANVEVNSGRHDDAMFKDLIKTKDKVLFV